MRPCVSRDGQSQQWKRERERVCVMGDLPLVFAGKVHHSWLGGSVVADGGLLEEAVELRAADSETVSGSRGQAVQRCVRDLRGACRPGRA